MEDVAVFYYPETSKGHDIGVIQFRQDMDKVIDCERVQVEFTYDTCYFKKDPLGKGLKLNNSKIQLWSFAYHAKNWEGQYPLKYDVEHGCYCIHREDAVPNERELPSKLGTSVNYTPHPGVTKPKEEPAGVEQPTCSDGRSKVSIVDNVNTLTDNKQYRSPYTKKKLTEIYLKDKIVDLLTKGRPNDGTILANALKIISEEDE